jgi:putative SOS response-associated peptidase YedK
MCGRYFRQSDKQRIAESFRLAETEESPLELAPSFNIAPTSMQPVIAADREGGGRVLRIMRWGLIPAWAKNPKALGLSTINAKAETLMEKPMWRTPFLRRRCLIPADGFYEWKKLDARTKQPYVFRLKTNQPFAFGGVWERWRRPEDGLALDTFSIITTDPNELTLPVHNRMPVILRPSDYDRWIGGGSFGDPGAAAPPLDLLRPYDSDAMTSYAVDPRVGNVRNDEPGLCTEWKCPPNSL